MMSNHAVRIEKILLSYKNQTMTRTARIQLYKEIAPYLTDMTEHIDKQIVMDGENRKLQLILKAKTPLGKLVLALLGDGAEEIT